MVIPSGLRRGPSILRVWMLRARASRDSTVITIGRVHYNELNLPCMDVVHHQWWTGHSHLEQYAATLALVEHWGIRSLAIEATGLGAGLASLLVTRLGEGRLVRFTFTRSSKSHLALPDAVVAQ